MPVSQSKIPNRPSHSSLPRARTSLKLTSPIPVKSSRFNTANNLSACAQRLASLNTVSVAPTLTPTSKSVSDSRTSRPPTDKCQIYHHKNHPHFVASHIGDPCTLGALDHVLDCGHKIVTDRPQSCASNCKYFPSEFLNTQDTFEPFICLACAIEEVKQRHDAKVLAFREELKAISSATRKELSVEEIARRLEVIEIGWHELDLTEIRNKVSSGKLSRPLYVQPGYEDAVEAVLDRDDQPQGRSV